MSFCIEKSKSKKNTSRNDDLIYNSDGIYAWSSNRDLYHHSEKGWICIGNGYLSNYEELSSEFILENKMNISELVLSGFKVYGINFFDKLDGGFSFGIVDIVNKKVLGFRDHFGNNSLFFKKTKQGFILSDDILDIVSTSVPEINYNALQNYFNFEESNSSYSSETFYKDIFRALPGHWVSCENEKVSQHFYWQPSLHKYIELKPSEQAKIFQEKLIHAVEKNINPKEKICTNLSGGLDSSTISSIAKMQNNEVNSLYFSTGHTSTDERFYANVVVNKWNLHHHEVQSTEDPLSLSKRLIEICKTPDMLFMPGTSFFLLGQKVKELGCTKILTGDGGDAIVAYGTEYMQDLYNQKEWQTLKQSIASYVKNRDLGFYFAGWPDLSNATKIKVYTDYFFGNRILAYLKKRELKKALDGFQVAVRNFKFSKNYIPRKALTALKTKFFAKKIDFQLLKNKYDSTQVIRFDVENLPKTFSPFEKEHFGYSFSNLNVAVIEQQNAIMRSLGVEAFHPFLDKNLIEVSVAVNSATRFDNGFGRGILRHATVDILPEEVRLRTTKVEFSEYLYSYFENLWNEARSEIGTQHRVWEFIEMAEFNKLILYIFDKGISYQKKTKYIWLANRTVQLALWLDFFDGIHAQHTK
ncbi:asparagine synthetase B family protein [Lacihabitans sp. CCS-44]|uniref:asparagine synthase-related protein n=1 Tax=Lacihabitans sp. CCS-44 TaxID=2487331 RepID=UPI0020CDD4D1|nr:asparagine synthetase B family protein [Lacihabitans sp. CCS-44]MCP9754757.1 asparagine synthetase B family protein [Lacihabitans sp. CCS-44]